MIWFVLLDSIARTAASVAGVIADRCSLLDIVCDGLRATLTAICCKLAIKGLNVSSLGLTMLV